MMIEKGPCTLSAHILHLMISLILTILYFEFFFDQVLILDHLNFLSICLFRKAHLIQILWNVLILIVNSFYRYLWRILFPSIQSFVFILVDNFMVDLCFSDYSVKCFALRAPIEIIGGLRRGRSFIICRNEPFEPGLILGHCLFFGLRFPLLTA